jgi:hypothetical protein
MSAPTRCCVPFDAADCERLRDICLRTLAFENDFLRSYVEYLRQELAGGPAARDRALEVLTLMPLDAASVREASHALASSEPAASSAANVLSALGARHTEVDEV